MIAEVRKNTSVKLGGRCCPRGRDERVEGLLKVEPRAPNKTSEFSMTRFYDVDQQWVPESTTASTYPQILRMMPLIPNIAVVYMQDGRSKLLKP
jgi:hypothetical protein